MKRCIVLMLCCYFFALAGCATTDPHADIADVKLLPQNASVYIPPGTGDTMLLSLDETEELWYDFRHFFFAPWARTEPKWGADTVSWGFTAFEPKPMFGMNKRPVDTEWFDRMRLLADMQTYPNDGRAAITVNNTSMRVFPTAEPIFRDFALAGEGFPFDYNQNTFVPLGTPLYLSHVSADGAWAMCESPSAFGWIPMEDVADAVFEFQRLFWDNRMAAIMRDNVTLYDCNDRYRGMGRLGMVLPVDESKSSGDEYTVLIPAKSVYGTAVMIDSYVHRDDISPIPLALTPNNVANAINDVLGKPYGWGGMYGQRDCSATLLDIFTPFGFPLLRNSRQQAESAEQTSFEGMKPEQVKQTILEQGIPFLTLIYRPGHIGLYIGQYEGEPVIVQTLWGIKTKEGKSFGRKIVGETVITTLTAGSELSNVADPDGIFLKKATAMTILPPDYDDGVVEETEEVEVEIESQESGTQEAQ